ncbi:MAG: SRPBCC domain-containing protein [Bacteroidetes bacterium]|nr:SRPBCC domain-containing protein [Bacteroidota bacterium]
MENSILKTIQIKAPVSQIWQAITIPEQMQKWMGEIDFNMKITTDWTPGKPIVIEGFHHVHFVNSGIVLAYDFEKKLSYNYLSSISRLPDKPENYTELEFTLEPGEEQTTLTLILRNFPNDSIYQHVNFYWNGTLLLLRDFILHKMQISI